ncbi:MAG: putative heme d1 biosynthesis radical SAM protein NirJ1 [Thermotaleaceae bacterium]
MVGVTKLLCGSNHFGDRLRYRHGAKEEKSGVGPGHGPVVVWNCTQSCNLKCTHCYASAENKRYGDELTTEEGKNLIDDLKAFRVPVLLFSGGEPFMREDLLELTNYASACNIRATISTNGTCIDKSCARDLKKAGVGYVGISLDGIGEKHDRFRGVKGAFDRTLEGIRNCLEMGQKVGLRFTLNRHNYDQLRDVFYLIQEEKIPRVCFYHLVYTGRGSEMIEEDVSHEETRAAMDLIADQAMAVGEAVEMLTVDNHADAVYLYLQSLKRYPHLSEEILKLIGMNGGNRSGMAFGAIDAKGNVHPDQFTSQYTFGNVREKPFGHIWTSTTHPIMAGLKDRKKLLKGRCGQCNWLSLCNGNFRARAEAATGDFWASDPACYLTDEEIGLKGKEQ